MARLGAALAILASGCERLGAPDTAGTWFVELGLPDQHVPVEALGSIVAPTVETWLAGAPWAFVRGKMASIAAPFVADERDPASIHLQGLYHTGDAYLWLASSDSGDTSGLDHDLSFSVGIDGEDGSVDEWVGVRIDGEPGCGGDPTPRAVRVFDADREDLVWDGAIVTVAGVGIALQVPDQPCVVAQ